MFDDAISVVMRASGLLAASGLAMIAGLLVIQYLLMRWAMLRSLPRSSVRSMDQGRLHAHEPLLCGPGAPRYRGR